MMGEGPARAPTPTPTPNARATPCHQVQGTAGHDDHNMTAHLPDVRPPLPPLPPPGDTHTHAPVCKPSARTKWGCLPSSRTGP